MAMKRAVQKQTAVVVRTAAPEKPVKICIREGCGKILPRGHKKFCCHVCRNKYLQGGFNGGGPEEKYKPEYAGKKLEAYLAECKTMDERTQIPIKSGYIILHESGLPEQDDYADWLGVDPSTFVRWAERHPEFARALDYLKRKQKMWLIRNGLSGRYTPVITKLMLGSNHGIVEKKDIDHKHTLLGFVKHVYSRADEIMPVKK